MTDLERIRHSAAHVLATAILRLWPEAQFAAGPPVENGFYYDVDLPHRISPEDFREDRGGDEKGDQGESSVRENRRLTRRSTRARKAGGSRRLAERPNPSKFKLGILEDIPEGEQISYIRNGDFIDLCAGPHVMRTGNIGAFKLTTWPARITRATKKTRSSNAFTARRSRTRPRWRPTSRCWRRPRSATIARSDRKWGCSFDDDVGPGLPLWLPRGAVIVEELEKLAKETEFAAGYLRVKTPHIAREKMYLTSGHLAYYADSMFPPMELEDKLPSLYRRPASSRTTKRSSKMLVSRVTLAA